MVTMASHRTGSHAELLATKDVTSSFVIGTEYGTSKALLSVESRLARNSLCRCAA